MVDKDIAFPLVVFRKGVDGLDEVTNVACSWMLVVRRNFLSPGVEDDFTSETNLEIIILAGQTLVAAHLYAVIRWKMSP